MLAAGRPTPLWHVKGAPADRAVFAGEARGLWLWAIVWPEQSGLLMYDELVLADLREAGDEMENRALRGAHPPAARLRAAAGASRPAGRRSNGGYPRTSP